MEIKRVDSRTVYANRWMTVREDEIQRADGSPGTYGVVEKSDFALIVPIHKDRFVLVEQYRYPVKHRFWEFPQGSRERARSTAPETLARAELAEETGFTSAKIRHLGHLFAAYGYSNQGFDVFLATDLSAGAPSRESEEQGMRVESFSAVQLREMIHGGQIKDAPTIAAYGLLSLS